MNDKFSIVTIVLCLAAGIVSIVNEQYFSALVFILAVYNICMWMWLDAFKRVK